MRKKILVILGLAIFIVAIFFLVFQKETTPEIKVNHVNQKIKKLVETEPILQSEVDQFGTQTDYSSNRILLEKFLQDKMIDNGGIYTNYLKSGTDGNTASGHDLLSESSGFYLQHLALTGTQKQFDRFYRQTKKIFYRHHQFSFRVTAKGKASDVNASLDDLRIMRSLILAKQRFKDDQYQKELKTISKYFLEQSTLSGLMIDFYDGKNQEKSNNISFFYLDYTTLAYIYHLNGVEAKVLQAQVNLAKQAQISEAFPLFKQSYSYQDESYTTGSTINIIESLLTVRYLAEIGEAPQESLDFIKENVAKGTLFNSYDTEGNPVDKNQSAASYAIAAFIGAYTKDETLYRDSLEILQRFQVTNDRSEIYGGIGEASSLEVYSFNNLTALLAFDL